MNLQINQVVKNKRGDLGIIAAFNNKPCLVIFKSYTMQLTALNEKLEHKNENYTITHVFNIKDGDTVLSMKDVYKAKFNPYESMELVYGEKEEEES